MLWVQANKNKTALNETNDLVGPKELKRKWVRMKKSLQFMGENIKLLLKSR